MFGTSRDVDLPSWRLVIEKSRVFGSTFRVFYETACEEGVQVCGFVRAERSKWWFGDGLMQWDM